MQLLCLLPETEIEPLPQPKAPRVSETLLDLGEGQGEPQGSDNKQYS